MRTVSKSTYLRLLPPAGTEDGAEAVRCALLECAGLRIAFGPEPHPRGGFTVHVEVGPDGVAPLLKHLAARGIAAVI